MQVSGARSSPNRLIVRTNVNRSAGSSSKLSNKQRRTRAAAFYSQGRAVSLPTFQRGLGVFVPISLEDHSGNNRRSRRTTGIPVSVEGPVGAVTRRGSAAGGSGSFGFMGATNDARGRASS